MSVETVNGHVFLPHLADWSELPSAARRWMTEISDGVTGAEDRSALRNGPFHSLEWRVVPSDVTEQVRLEARVLEAMKRGNASIPWFGRGLVIVTAVSADTFEVEDTPWLADLSAGDFICFLSGPRDGGPLWEVGEISEINSNEITLVAPVSSGPWPAGAYCYPVISGRFTVEAMPAVTGHVGAWAFRVDGPPGEGELSVSDPGDDTEEEYVYDDDVLIFIDTTETVCTWTLTLPQKHAVNELVQDLKAAGVWDKLDAIYPFVGGTACRHKWNLKDPRDLDGAFRITWHGGVTHDANGITGDGSSGYGDTHWAPAGMMTNYDTLSMAVYCSGGPLHADRVYEMGATSFGGVEFFHQQWIALGTDFLWRGDGIDGHEYHSLAITSNRGAVYMDYYTGPAGQPLGFWVATFNPEGDSRFQWYRNGDASLSFGQFAGYNERAYANMYILASSANNSEHPEITVGGFSDRTLSFASLGHQKLSATEVAAYYAAVQAYQHKLGRALELSP